MGDTRLMNKLLIWISLQKQNENFIHNSSSTYTTDACLLLPSLWVIVKKDHLYLIHVFSFTISLLKSIFNHDSPSFAFHWKLNSLMLWPKVVCISFLVIFFNDKEWFKHSLAMYFISFSRTFIISVTFSSVDNSY